jgi:hypothetical protein
MVAAPYENDQNYFILYQVIKKDKKDKIVGYLCIKINGRYKETT